MIIDRKDLTLYYKCKMRHSKSDDFKIIECKLIDKTWFVSHDNLYFESKILRDWPELKIRWPNLYKIKIEYSSVGQNIIHLYDKDNKKLMITGYMTLFGVEANVN